MARPLGPAAAAARRAFHAALYVPLPVHTFSATMVLLYLAAVDPDAVARAVAGLAPRAGEEAA